MIILLALPHYISLKPTVKTMFNWLVVWNILYFSIQLGMPSSQLTNSIIFFRGVVCHQPCLTIIHPIIYPLLP